MRKILRVGCVCFGVIALALAGGLAWAYFDTRDLPDTESLAQFAPARITRVDDPCRGTSSIAVPYELIGDGLRSALGVAEIPEDAPKVIDATFRLVHAPREFKGGSLSMRVARAEICSPANALNHEASELRFAVQLERHFSQRELFTMFANRTSFGGDNAGIESASQRFFHKEPNQLSTDEAALIAGLARNPSRYSPLAHLERALIRRNDVLDAMAQRGLINQAQAGEAKLAPLGVVSQ